LTTIPAGVHAGHDHTPNRFGVLTAAELRNAETSLSGRGVTIAFLDSGFYPHPDLRYPEDRILACPYVGLSCFWLGSWMLSGYPAGLDHVQTSSTLQVSSNNFSKCVRMSSQPTAGSGNLTFTVLPAAP
jgi:hypothetical protein